MAKTANIHVRMDEQIKNDAVAVLDNLGISVAEAITMYFRQVALKNGIPFELTADPVFRKNIDRVSKLKIDDLRAVLAVVPESVDELWVFGSAVTEHCRPDSDLDVCVIGDNITREDRKVMAHAPRRGMDLLNVSHEEFAEESRQNGSIFHEVLTKGIPVYRKGEGII